MPTVNPWHSTKQFIHHNHTECQSGKQVKPEDRRPGTGGKPLCSECVQLNQQRR
jgi:hypothetical protein